MNQHEVSAYVSSAFKTWESPRWQVESFQPERCVLFHPFEKKVFILSKKSVLVHGKMCLKSSFQTLTLKKNSRSRSSRFPSPVKSFGLGVNKSMIHRIFVGLKQRKISLNKHCHHEIPWSLKHRPKVLENLVTWSVYWKKTTYLPSLKLTACTWKWMVGRLVSFWDGLFSGTMLVLGSVYTSKEKHKNTKKHSVISSQLGAGHDVFFFQKRQRTKHLGAEFIIFGRETPAFQQIAPMHVACFGRAWLSHYTSLHENPAKACGEDTTSIFSGDDAVKSRKNINI